MAVAAAEPISGRVGGLIGKKGDIRLAGPS